MTEQKQFRRSTPKYETRIFVDKSLIIETYIIGYSHQGESVLFFIKYDGIIAYSGMIDCYKTKNANHIKRILDDNQVTELNFICWSHPDLDHSKGMAQIIEEYTSEKTKIWIPEDVEFLNAKCSDYVKNLFLDLRDQIKSPKTGYKVFTASDNKNLLCYGDSICFTKLREEYPLRISSLTPSSNIIRKQSILEKFIKNDRSIVILLELGGASLLFAADAEDALLNEIANSLLPNAVHILKIPHHGSETSQSLIGRLGDCDIACSTVYRPGKLPNEEVMNNYKKIADSVLCTGKKTSKDETSNYGIIKIETDILNERRRYSLEGNACEWDG